MQTRITGLERDLEDVQEREQRWTDGENRVRAMEQELLELRRVRFLNFFQIIISRGHTVGRRGEDFVHAVPATGAGSTPRGACA